jgi:hypothetical protein
MNGLIDFVLNSLMTLWDQAEFIFNVIADRMENLLD